MKRPEILFLAHRIPYPPDKGDKIRSWRLFEHLCRRFDVHLACFIDDPGDHAHTAFLRARSASAAFIDLDPRTARVKSMGAFLCGEPLSFHYFRSRRMAKAVSRARERPLVAEVAFSSAMAPYLEKAVLNRPRIIDFCDADSEKWRQYVQTTHWPLSSVFRREAESVTDAETSIANWADAAFAASPEEANVFNERARVRREVDWLRNGVDAGAFDPGRFYPAPPFQPDVAFVGAMDYRANAEAVLTFARTTWPLVRAQSPDARFAVVGRNPGPDVRALDGRNGVTVTGAVCDVRIWLSAAKLVAAPLLVARGVQNKVLEAMAMAKPVVATPQAIAGVQGAHEAVCTACDPPELAAHILELIADPERRNYIGEKARKAVIQHHDWGVCLSRLDAAFERLGLYKSSSPPSSSSILVSA